MVRINLLPPEILQRRRSEKLVGYAAVAGVALTAVLLAVWGVALFMVSSANQDLQGKKDQAASLQKAAEAFAIFESKEADLAVRRSVVDAALAARVDWARLLSELSLVLPADQWLVRLAAVEEGPPNLTMEGRALDPLDTPDGGHKSIAATLIRLADLEQLSNAWLSRSEKNPDEFDPFTVIDFEVTADLTTVTTTPTANAAPAPPVQP